MEGERKRQMSDDGAAQSPTKRPRGESDETVGKAVESNSGKRGTPVPSTRALTPPLLLSTRIDRDADEYPMYRKEKSIALIFNHINFKNAPMRSGTDYDVIRLQETFKKLNFEVKFFNDKDYSTIMKIMNDFAKMDHTNRDCIAVIVLTHGHRNGRLAASDVDYEVDQLLKYVIPRSCPTLAGKPKLFFIQACKGDGADSGVILSTIKDAIQFSPQLYPVASYADILISYATFEGQCAIRKSDGSWYISTLCDQLDLHGTDMDLLTLLTRLNRIVNQGFRSESPDNPRDDGIVQAPSFTSSLTRRFCFRNTMDHHN